MALISIISSPSPPGSGWWDAGEGAGPEVHTCAGARTPLGQGESRVCACACSCVCACVISSLKIYQIRTWNTAAVYGTGLITN